jgi:hypothetical protein
MKNELILNLFKEIKNNILKVKSRGEFEKEKNEGIIDGYTGIALRIIQIVRDDYEQGKIEEEEWKIFSEEFSKKF